MNSFREDPRPRGKLTLMLDSELRQRIESERRRIESESGFRVSRTQIVERALRQALAAGLAGGHALQG